MERDDVIAAANAGPSDEHYRSDDLIGGGGDLPASTVVERERESLLCERGGGSYEGRKRTSANVSLVGYTISPLSHAACKLFLFFSFLSDEGMLGIIR